MASPQIHIGNGMNGTDKRNGVNGVHTPPLSPHPIFSQKLRSASRSSSCGAGSIFGSVTQHSRRATHSYTTSVVQESIAALRAKSASQLGAAVCHSADHVSFIDLLKWIHLERNRDTPDQASRWDRVIDGALYFAEQLHRFEQAIHAFAPGSGNAAALGYGHTKLLLEEVGRENSDALYKAFRVFYKFAVSSSMILRRSEILSASQEIREELCLLFCDLLSLVVDVAVRFYKTVKGMTSSFAALDIYETFGHTITSVRDRQNKVTTEIWTFQLEKAGVDLNEELDVTAISRWLAPQDRVLASLGRDLIDNEAKSTCTWFQKHLSRFIQSDKSLLVITGQPGSGKSALAASIAERLQRPVKKRSPVPIFCSISSDIPGQATSLSVVKNVLSQLLNARTGNVAVYRALAYAYEQSRSCPDTDSYEKYLWQALEESVKRPMPQDNDLVVIIDGLEELTDGAKASSTLLDKLLKVVKLTKHMKLIALSSTLDVPSNSNGIQHQISGDEVHDEIYAVAFKALARKRQFTTELSGPDQVRFVDRVVHAANGSFLWTILACGILRLQQSGETITKALDDLESSRLSIQALVQKLFLALNLSNEAKSLLSWVITAERPLTTGEIGCLFNIDSQRATFVEKQVDVLSLLNSLQPFLSVQEGIIRMKHSSIRSALQDLAQQSKISLPFKESQVDLLLRLLTYAKTTLRGKGEPSMDVFNPNLVSSLFDQHLLLEYMVRYWVLHLKRSPLAPTASGEPKPSTDLSRVFPDTAILPILEATCWSVEYPISLVVELQVLTGKIRRTILTENHVAVLQTYISCATCYTFYNTSEAQAFYYLSAKVGRTVLSETHPLTIECAEHFLKITETMTSTTRTEIMTHREEILIILIAAYERQYGTTSDLVIKTRELLAKLYNSIKEEERGMEIYRLIQEALIKHRGKHSHEVEDIQRRLVVVLGKGKDHGHIDTYTEPFFTGDDDDEDIVEVFSIERFLFLLKQAEYYTSRKRISMAEKIYVELWLEVSHKCRTVRSVEWHEKHLEIAVAYSKFLCSQKRISEANSVLVCVSQYYEQHQLSFTESIVTRLVTVAQTLRAFGHYSMALSIFKHASSYYKSVRKEESSVSVEIHREISETSAELVKQSLTNTATTEITTAMSESTFKEVFYSVIKSSKTIESTTMTLAKRLTTRYMEQRNWSAAIEIVKETLTRTWSSFLSVSIHDVTLTTTFRQESIELIERLAVCYLNLKQHDKVKDVYMRLFRSILVLQQLDQTLLDRAITLLVGFYDKHGYVDDAISVYQELLVVYRSKLGINHEKTIQSLYILASRCRSHPRNHPYWIEYYLQIVTILNKDSGVCHKDAMDAIIIVATTYWEDRRYAEAVTVFNVLWTTFIRKTKEYKQFSDTAFVQILYERYFQCLEETKASWEVLHKVTSEYRETCIATFTRESSITVEATLALARVTQRSDEHASQAISLYEEVSSSSKSTTINMTEIRQTLSSLYVSQLKSKSSTVKTETIERAITMTQEQFSQATAKYGYAHQTTLAHLRELAVLYYRQQKTDIAVKRLTTAATEIITKEKSAEQLIEAAASIAASFQACEQATYCTELIQELHRQICAKDSRYVSKWSFDVTKCDRSALTFLATLQYHLCQDKLQTFAEIMADITMQFVYFEEYRRVMSANESLRNILLAAAPLRSCLRRYYQDLASHLEEELIRIFQKRDAADINTLNPKSPRIFIIAILDYLSEKRSRNFNRAVILACNERVASLTKAKRFQEAYDVANLGFLFASHHNGYSTPKTIGSGFKLASLLVGADGEKCPEPGLRKKSLELSNHIVKKILDISKDLNISLVSLPLNELSQLVRLLGEQEDYATLEWLLSTLWATRDAQDSWHIDILTHLRHRLICAQFLTGNSSAAIKLCERTAYNMGRTYGPRAPPTIAIRELLAQLYTSAAQTLQAKPETAHLAVDYFKKALEIHEDMLRLSLHERGDGHDEDEERDTIDALLAAEHAPFAQASVDRSALAIRHLRLLKLAYQRLGGWPKAYEEYEQLNAEVFRVFGGAEKWKGAQGVEKWSAKEFGSGQAEAKDGGFEGLEDWGFVGERVDGAEPHMQEYVS